jgi:hypothetical protein
LNEYLERDITFTRWLFRAYVLVLFLLPMPLGSNRPFFWSAFVAAVALIALVWALGWLTGVADWPAAARRAKWALLALLLFFAWAAAQIAVLEMQGNGLGNAAALFGSDAAAAAGPDVSQLAARAIPEVGSVSVYDSLDSLLLSGGLILLAFLTLVL